MPLGHTEQKDKDGFPEEPFLITLSEKQGFSDAAETLKCILQSQRLSILLRSTTTGHLPSPTRQAQCGRDAPKPVTSAEADSRRGRSRPALRTWKWGLDTHLASCRKSGSMIFTNSDGSITSKISSNSFKNMTSFGL